MDPTRNPDPNNSLMRFSDCCQDQIARFSMQPPDYDNYSELAWSFSVPLTPYDVFHRQMSSLLQNPQYAHLRVHWDVFHQDFLGEQQMLHHPLFLFPIALCILLNIIPYSAQPGDTLWHRAQEHWDQKLTSHRASELSNIQNRRYIMAGIDKPVGELDPEASLLEFLYWYQEQAARFTMRPEDYRKYVGFRVRHRTGDIGYGEYRHEMGELLGAPEYEYLRVWWHVHEMEVRGLMPMVENPFVTFPLAFCVVVNVALYIAMFGDALWRSYLDRVLSRVRRQLKPAIDNVLHTNRPSGD